jgi:ABC-2 type transport system ATP-binding protein
MIEIRDLSHCLVGTRILENIHLTVPDGTIMGLVGINGAGKSTLLRLMSGVYIAD